MAVHVCADDVHLFGMGGAHFGAEHHVAWTGRRRLHIQFAQLDIGLRHRIGVHAGPGADAAQPAAALCLIRSAGGGTASTPLVVRRVILVCDAAGWTTVAFELRVDPVDRSAIAIRSLTAIAEL